MVTGFIIAAFVIGILGWMWRINLAINHPEKEQRLRELGRNTWNEQVEVAQKLADQTMKAINKANEIRRRLKK